MVLGQNVRSEVHALVDSISQYGKLDGPYIGYAGIRSQQYDRINRLTGYSTTKELLDLTNNDNAIVRCAVFESLCLKDSVDVIPLVIANLYDTSLIVVQQGCIGRWQIAGDYILRAFYSYLATKDSSYFAQNHSDLVAIDSILFYDPKVRLAHKEARIKGINGDTLYYNRIRDIAINERIAVSVLALAKYRKQQDKEIIASYFVDDQAQYYAIWAVREFPDSSFYPLLVKVFEKQWKKRYYSYPKWRILYQALAQYPNDETLKMFDKTIRARNKFRRQTLGTYLLIAINKYPDPMFDKYVNAVKLDKFHRENLVEESNIEN